MSDRPDRSKRVTMNVPGKLMTADGITLTVQILDISKDGFRVSAPETLFVGERVRLELGRSGFADAEILWVQGNECGGVFHFPLNV